MKRPALLLAATILLALATIAAALIPSVARADRADVWLASTVDVHEVRINELRDGGCALTACGTYRKADGGLQATCTDKTELAAGSTAQIRCLNVLSSADTAFKAAEGL